MADEITAGGNGTDGRLSLLGADGKPIVGMQIVTRRAPSLKDTRIDVGAPDRPGLVALFNSDGDQTALLTPQSLAIGGRGRSGEKSRSGPSARSWARHSPRSLPAVT